MAPSALADAAAGATIGAAGWPAGGAPWLLLAASFCAYHGGMALNDWADRGRDARARPERPLPSGAIAPGAALAVAVLLLAGAPILGALAAPRAGAALLGVSLCAAVYDVAGRGPWLGPLLLGLCRAGNLCAGVLLGLAWRGGELDAWVLLPPAVYGAYVLVLSRLGRMEDAEDAGELGRRPSALLLGAAGLIVAAALVPLSAPAADGPGFAPVALVLALLGAAPLAVLALRTPVWTRGAVLGAMGLGLRRLLVVTAVLAARVGTADAYVVSAAILAGYGVSWGLRRVFPPS
jgi:4-hydroxybenzoate polyprenyltransferase